MKLLNYYLKIMPDYIVKKASIFLATWNNLQKYILHMMIWYFTKDILYFLFLFDFSAAIWG